MATQKNLDKAYMQCARAIAALSRAKRKTVGAIIVSANGHGIIAEGFNGTPSGFDNCCENASKTEHYLTFQTDLNQFYCHECKCFIQDDMIKQANFISGRTAKYHDYVVLTTKSEVIHAEANAIAKVARSTNSSAGATLYCTLSPCFECAKQIIQAGIVRVVYAEQYPYAGHTGEVRAPGLDLLRQANIEVELCGMND